MHRTTPLLAVCVVLFSGIGALATATLSNGPEECEQRSSSADVEFIRAILEGQHTFPGVFVQTRGQPGSPYTFLVQVQVVPNRGVRTTILSPISHQGSVSFDDFKKLQRYDPDRRLVEIGPSYYKLQPSPRSRASMISRNYTVTLGPDETVASRRCTVIECKPRSAGLPSRRMHVDAFTNVILQYDIAEPGKDYKSFLKTKSVDYSRGNALRNFELSYPSDSTTVVHEWGPVDIKSAAAVSSQIGFTPRIPRVLPYGFMLQESQLVGTAREPYVRLFLSDGLAGLFVYQVSSDRKPSNVRRFERRPIHTDRHGIEFFAEGDVSHEIQRTIVERIAEQL